MSQQPILKQGNFQGKTVLVTGCAGFIGFHTAKCLLAQGKTVIGLDNFNSYYDVSLKEDRVKLLKKYPRFVLYRGGLENIELIKTIFAHHVIEKVCHLAAQAGVRFSLENPHTYIQSNIVGFANLIEEARVEGVKHFVYASSSSVYGKNNTFPYTELQPVDEQMSLYAATKRSNELLAHTYSHLFGMQCTGLRFFTVYGPWGRPDMALFSFTKKIMEGQEIDVYGEGEMLRDFTYIDDIVAGVLSALERPLAFEIINLGRGEPRKLMEFIEAIEHHTGKRAKKKFLPIQPGDMTNTYADITKAKEVLGYNPKMSLHDGVKQFVDWYRTYYDK